MKRKYVNYEHILVTLDFLNEIFVGRNEELFRKLVAHIPDGSRLIDMGFEDSQDSGLVLRLTYRTVSEIDENSVSPTYDEEIAALRAWQGRPQ